MAVAPSLRSLLAERMFVVAPGVYDMVSAMIADRLGFAALYMTGYGVSASHLGRPDAGLVTYRDMVERARTIAGAIGRPLIADADTGFGGLLNVRETVRGYEAAGVAAIQIEDQESPKKCGHTPGRRVVPLREACRRIEVAVEARRDSETLIVARTDARTSQGLGEALARARAFAAAGADVLFVEAPESEAEFERIGGELGGHALLANIVPTGRSPAIPAERLKRYGFAIAIHPVAGLVAAAAAIRATYEHLAAHGDCEGAAAPRLSMAELHDLVGFPDVWDFEKRWAEDAG
jgi:2-methylisocitrate lyase-like PEP mutase family enzyme